MIDYATWSAIRDGVAQHLTAVQLADSLGLDVKTVRHWMAGPMPHGCVSSATANSIPSRAASLAGSTPIR